MACGMQALYYVVGHSIYAICSCKTWCSLCRITGWTVVQALC